MQLKRIRRLLCVPVCVFVFVCAIVFMAPHPQCNSNAFVACCAYTLVCLCACYRVDDCCFVLKVRDGRLGSRWREQRRWRGKRRRSLRRLRGFADWVRNEKKKRKKSLYIYVIYGVLCHSEKKTCGLSYFIKWFANIFFNPLVFFLVDELWECRTWCTRYKFEASTACDHGFCPECRLELTDPCELSWAVKAMIQKKYYKEHANLSFFY